MSRFALNRKKAREVGMLAFFHAGLVPRRRRDEVGEEGGPPRRDRRRRSRRGRRGRLRRGHLSQEAVPLGLVDEAALPQYPQHRLIVTEFLYRLSQKGLS